MIESKFFNGGKGYGLPPKSLILLSITTHQRKNYDDRMFREETNLKRSWFCEWLYRSVKLVKAEILEGIGPSKPEPCNCLQKLKKKTCLVLYVCSRGHAKVLMEKEVNSYSFIILVQLPIKSGIRPVKLLSLILLGSHKYNHLRYN